MVDLSDTSVTALTKVGASTTARSLLGLTSGEAVPGTTITFSFPVGVTGNVIWGETTPGDATWGAGSSPDPFAGGTTLAAMGFGDDGVVYTASAPIGASDTTAPVVESSSIVDKTVSATITEQNPERFFVVGVANPSTPSAAQIVAGTGGGILEAAQGFYTAGYQEILVEFTNGSIDEIHFVFRDAAGNTSDIEIIPGVVVDVTAPVVSGVSGTSTGETTADWSATSDEAGGAMFAAARLATDATLPAADIEQGTGNAVAISVDASPTADANNGGSFTGLTSATEYDIDVFQRDASGNESAVVASAASFTTASANSIAFLSEVFELNDFGATPENFTPVGTALTALPANSKVAVMLVLAGGQDPRATAVTIGGVAASLVTQSASNSSVDVSTAIWEAAATGTFSSDIVQVDPDAALDDSNLYLVNTTGLTLQSGLGGSTDQNGGSADQTVNTTAQAGDQILAVAGCASNSGSAAFTAGVTTDPNSPDSFGGREAVFGINTNATGNDTVTASLPTTGDRALSVGVWR